MLVQIDVTSKEDNCLVYSDVENWDLYDSVSDIYKAALKEYGRCISKIYVDGKDNAVKHVGWVFQKRCKYEDCNETYLQETWVCPLKRYEKKTEIEYAL